MGLFSRRTADEPVETVIGPGVRVRGGPEQGDSLKVERYHRGSKILFEWPESNRTAADQAETVANCLQKHIDLALDRLDSDEAMRENVLANGSLYPEGVDWFASEEKFDFVLTFGYVGWPDGSLEFYFKDGVISDVGHTG